MAHPGKIVYSHTPATDGVRFFYITYSRRLNTCGLKGALDGEETVEFELTPREMFAYLKEQDHGWHPEVTRRASKALAALIELRGL